MQLVIQIIFSKIITDRENKINVYLARLVYTEQNYKRNIWKFQIIIESLNKMSPILFL